MKRNKGKGLCGGAGGAQIFKESENGTVEINIERIKEVEKSNAETATDFELVKDSLYIRMMKTLNSSGTLNETSYRESLFFQICLVF